MNTTYTTEDGCVVVAYTLNNETVKKLIDLILDEVKAMLPEMEGVSIEDLEAELDAVEAKYREPELNAKED